MEGQEIRKALEDGALDVLAPSSCAQKDVAEFRERVMRWIEDFDKRTNASASSSSGTLPPSTQHGGSLQALVGWAGRVGHEFWMGRATMHLARL